jgi:hypothetical protein
VDRDRGAMPEDLQAVPELAMIKVSRRDRRAMERLSGPKAPSSRVLAAAVAALVFAVGFLLGRLGSVEPAGPSVRALPAAEALAPLDVEGSAAYLLWTNEPLVTIAVHSLVSGDVVPRARFSPPFEATDDARTQVVALGQSVAVVLSDGPRSFVAFAPEGGPSHGWVSGIEAAWSTPHDLWVRQSDSSIVRWALRSDGLHADRFGRAQRVLQGSRGAFLQRAGELEAIGNTNNTFALPRRGRVLATDGTRTLVEDEGLYLWNGVKADGVRLDGIRALSASFEPGGSRVATIVAQGDELTVAVIDERGNASLKPLRTSTGPCRPTLAWDRSGSWIYVSSGDGGLHAVEATGGRVEPVRTHGVGCGIAWTS